MILSIIILVLSVIMIAITFGYMIWAAKEGRRER